MLNIPNSILIGRLDNLYYGVNMKNASITIVLDSLQSSARSVQTIYQIDTLVEQAVAKGEHTIIINEPAAAILQQIYTKRPNYNTVFKVS